MLTACSGSCCLCANLGNCFASSGDDHFTLASEDQLRQRLYTMKTHEKQIRAELEQRSKTL